MGEIILLGLILAIIFYELTDISPGGLIVPGLLAYYLYDPFRILLTIFVAMLTCYLVKWLSRYIIIYGKRRFAVMIIVSVLIGTILSAFTKEFQLLIFDIPIVGYIIPGIIASEMNKQGLIKTVSALLIVVLMTGLIVFLI